MKWSKYKNKNISFKLPNCIIEMSILDFEPMALSNTVQIQIISREKNSIQASQRRMERKLKELNATLDQERSQHVEQRDQVNSQICI